jgi:ribosome biogenesis GTPase / thiamine phosphate phosphatase
VELSRLGWNKHFLNAFKESGAGGCAPARVTAAHRGLYSLGAEQGDFIAGLSGALRARMREGSPGPVVGDWVTAALRPAEGRGTVHAVLPRQNAFSRRSAGPVTAEQVIAANLDAALIVTAADGDFNPRRVERYVALAWTAGLPPLVILNKIDLAADPQGMLDELACAAPGAPVLGVNARDGTGVEELRARIGTGLTAALLGSSGVGKSTLLNRLLGMQVQDTCAVRADDSRGRHTTTRRELFLIPGGGLLIDNPGMREVGLWGGSTGVAGAFSDVEEMAAECRFSDCAHESEPGCAVLAAVAEGRLPPERLSGYRKLLKETRYVASLSDQRLRLEEKLRWKKISRQIRQHFQHEG